MSFFHLSTKPALYTLNINQSSKVNSSGNLPVFLRFLGSMNLAIMLLVTVAIASVIGTLLIQNEPYQNYIIKFGPFWHELYKNLGLYDVYSSGWFVVILAFLVLSTSVCVYRNTPEILRSMRRFKEDIQEQAITNMPQNTRWETNHEIGEIRHPLLLVLKRYSYRTRIKEEQGFVTVAAMKGSSNRVGYLLTHMAIIIICAGGLIDGNLPLKLKILNGDIKIETRDLAVSEIPAASRLSASNPSFRASVSIPENARVNYAFINIANGFLLQSLPFTITVRDFRIEHYDTGQPKSFESDLIINDTKNNEEIEQTISVNHPMVYKGYTIYQSSFGDGGTRLNLQIRNFFQQQDNPLQLNGIINTRTNLETSAGKLKIEFDDFRKFNIFPADNPENRKFKDYGPSFSFKIRKTDGTASEYVNYMYPVYVDNRSYFLSGVRFTAADELRYLYIPVDSENSPERFFRFLSLLSDNTKIESVINQSLQKVAKNTGDLNDPVKESLAEAMLRTLELFRNNGTNGIINYVNEQIPEKDRDNFRRAYFKILDTVLWEVYLEVLKNENIDTDKLDKDHHLFFDEAVNAINAIHLYGSPFYLQLTGFDHKEATGLQITRTPGQKIVYLGFGMLIIGVFLLFYIAHQRLWLMLIPLSGNKTRILMAGTRVRHRREFAGEFERLSRDLESVFN